MQLKCIMGKGQIGSQEYSSTLHKLIEPNPEVHPLGLAHVDWSIGLAIVDQTYLWAHFFQKKKKKSLNQQRFRTDSLGCLSIFPNRRDFLLQT